MREKSLLANGMYGYKEMWRVMALLRYAAYLHLVRGT